ADPLDTDLNQLLLAYSQDNTNLVLGRQRIIRGNARFVGNVGWRQHEQTYDALSIENKSVKDLTVFAAYIDRRNTITFGYIDQDTVLIDVEYAGITNATLSAYYYDLKVDDSRTEWENIGVRIVGELAKFAYSLEYSTQETGNGAKPDYTLLEGRYTFKHASLAAGLEILGSDANTGFATPLATLHKFNGWADQFLTTPAQGLEDKYLKLTRKHKDLTAMIVFHQFDADRGDIDFGSEIDLMISKSFSKKYTLGVKYADFSAGDFAGNKVDVSKFWLWAEARF
ncbi:MAG: alginate export family protein, partial [Gammaproteobacteria bacterium]|nr:alginate export family protein [Gammaproteobacteria bacterium]